MAEATEDTRVLQMTTTPADGGEPEVAEYMVKDFNPEQVQIYNKLQIIQEKKGQLIANANFDVECQTVLERHFMTQIRDTLVVQEGVQDDAGDEEAEFTEE